MNPQLNKIFSKLAKEDKKTELKSEKVELALADDLKKLNANISAIEKDLRANAKKGFDLTSVNKKTKTAIFYIEHNNGYTKFKKENN